jgi:hypothetical protein
MRKILGSACIVLGIIGFTSFMAQADAATPHTSVSRQANVNKTASHKVTRLLTDIKPARSTAVAYVHSDTPSTDGTVCSGLTVVLTGAPASTAWSFSLQGFGKAPNYGPYQQTSTDVNGNGTSPEFNVIGSDQWVNGKYRLNVTVNGAAVAPSTFTVNCV